MKNLEFPPFYHPPVVVRGTVVGEDVILMTHKKVPNQWLLCLHNGTFLAESVESTTPTANKSKYYIS